jgi:hypothetical protein
MLLLDLPSAAATDTLAGSLRRQGLSVLTLSPVEGYLESGWFDLDARATVRPPFSRFERVVKLRFFVDPLAEHTRVFAECVVRSAWDPSLPPLELERMPAAGHPGRVVLDSVLAAVKAHVVTDTARATGPPLRN